MARRIEIPKIPSGAHIGVARLRTMIALAETDPDQVQPLARALGIHGTARSIINRAKLSLANVGNW